MAAFRIMVRLASVLGLLAVTAVVLTAVLFVWPRNSNPRRADAVVVLAGDHGERLPVALRMIASGVTSTLVHDGEPDSPQARDLCRGGQPFEVICLSPLHDNTRQEARAAGKLANARGWKKIVVVSSTQHVTRVRLLFRRCVDGAVETVAADPHFGWRLTAVAIRHEWLGLLYALTVGRGC